MIGVGFRQTTYTTYTRLANHWETSTYGCRRGCRRGISSYTTYTPSYIIYPSMYLRVTRIDVGDVGEKRCVSCVRA